MNTYFYRLLTKDGRVTRGFIRLGVARDFSARLLLERRDQAVVLTLRRLPQWFGQGLQLSNSLRRVRLSNEELGSFLRDLSVMLRAGIAIFEALATLAEETGSDRHKRSAALASRLLEDLNAGASVSEAFARHPDLFPETVRNLTLVGEESGELDRMLLEAAEHVERVAKIGRDVRAAMIYPTFVFLALLGAASFWVFYVIPSMSELFAQMNAKLPPLTLWILAFAHGVLDNALWVLVLGLVVGVGAWLAVSRSQRVRGWLHLLLHRLPITRVLMHASGMARITEHLALLIRAGVDMLRSLEILERSTGDEYFRRRIAAMRQVVQRGERIAVAMRQVGGFPAIAVRMISVGEETGTLGEQLRYLAADYRERQMHLIASLGELLKPLVILFAGALFIILAMALFLPVYDLVRQAVAL